MDDEPVAPISVETPAPAAEPVAPEATPEIAPVEAPVETPAEPVVEAPAVETPAEEVPAPEVPAEETPTAESAVEPTEEAPTEEAPAEEPPAEEAVKPTYEAFNLPEGIQAAPEQITQYTEVLGKYGLTQEAGQELMDLHATSLKEMHDSLVQRQTDVFNDMRADWRKQFDEAAGNSRNTILDNAKFAVTSTLKSPEARKEFWNALGLTGAGDHPAVVNGLAAIGKRFREGTAPAKGLPAPAANGGRPWERRYAPKN